jgi:CRP/FNR family transcriptional regulator
MKTVSEKKFVQTFPYFASDSGSIAEKIVSTARLETADAETVLQWEGDYCESLGFMLAGEKRVYKIGESGREITLYEVGPGEICILNAACILSGTRCPVNASTITDAEMLSLRPADFIRLIHESPLLRGYVFKIISDNFALLIQLIDEIVFNKMDMRLGDYLLEKSENGVLETTHQRIADDLGTAREVISRLLKSMEKKGQLAIERSRIRLRIH